jgi:hypothetical protein
MAWTYLVESEESQKPLKDMWFPSPTVKTTDTLKAYCYLAWVMEIYHEHQSGTMCERLNPKCSQRSTSSTEGSHARTLALRAAEEVWMQSVAAYSLRSLGLSATYDLASSSWRTSQRLLFEDQNELLASFAASGMTVDGAFYPLQTWARITAANDGGSWPTPTVNMVSGGANHQSPTVKAGRHGINLKGAVMQWPTPTAEPFRSRSGKRKGEMGLERMAKMWPTPRTTGLDGGSNSRKAAKAMGMWPTPTSRDHKDGSAQSCMNVPVNSLLGRAVHQWPTPRAADGDKGIRTAEGSARERARRKNGQDLPTMAGGSLNPTWVEWLMGYRSGWTVCADWATQWFRPKRGKRSKG